MATLLGVGATAFSMGSVTASAAVSSLYVSPTGSDSNSGTSTSPFKTIQKALNSATPGVTIHVLPGTYITPTLTTPVAGTSTGRITLMADTPTPGAVHIVGTTANGTDRVIHLSKPYYTIQGFDIQGPGLRVGIDVDNAAHARILQNTIHYICDFHPGNNGGAAMEVYNDSYTAVPDIVIDRNFVYGIGQGIGTDQVTQGIYVDIPCVGGRITNNLVRDVCDFGIHSYHNPQYWTIANNTVAKCGRGILSQNNSTVRNNISAYNLSSQYDIRGSGNVLSNNLAFGSGATTKTGVIVADPKFVNYTGGDYHLQAGSPARNRGTTTNMPPTDFSGTIRPQGSAPDMGCYEQS